MNLLSTPAKTGNKLHQKMYHRTLSSGKAVPNICTVNRWRNKKIFGQVDP